MSNKIFVGVIGLCVISFIFGFIGGSFTSEHKLNRALISKATEPVYYKTWCETRGGKVTKDGDKELCLIKK